MSIFVKNTLSAVSVDVNSFISNFAECCTVNINSENHSLTIIGIYRPPNASISDFNDCLSDRLLAGVLRNNFVLCRDFNIGALNPSSPNLGSETEDI